jgi:putative colanic acid biosynthesis UDP-glucose lipid carrier transferase
MNEPVIFKGNLALGLLPLLRSIAPALVSVVMLFATAQLYGVDFSDHFKMLAVLLVILAPLVIQQPRIAAFQLMPSHWSAVASLLARWFLLLAILLAIGYVTKFSAEFSRRVVLTWALLTPAALIATSLGLNETIRRLVLTPENLRKAVFAGYNDVSLALAERLHEHLELGVSVQGYFDDRSQSRLGLAGGSSLLGGLSDLAAYVKEQGIEVIFIALPMRHVQRVLDLLDDLRDTTASIYYVPDIFVFDLIQSRSGEVLGMPVVAMCETPFHGYRGVVKRLMDVVISLAALAVLAPVMLAVAVLVKASSPGPVFFRQRRYGLDGQEIRVFKFRTMTVMEDGGQIRQATEHDERITPLGRFLRRYSLDELPQLFNVLGGSMSLVGPRPHAVAHNEEYRRLIKGYMIRHKVPPGITGLAQVNGCRGETAQLEDMQARVDYDLEYLRRWTPLLDLKIMWRTAMIFLNDRRAY